MYGSGRAAVAQPGDIGPVPGNRYSNAMYLQGSTNFSQRLGLSHLLNSAPSSSMG